MFKNYKDKTNTAVQKKERKNKNVFVTKLYMKKLWMLENCNLIEHL